MTRKETTARGRGDTRQPNASGGSVALGVNLRLSLRSEPGDLSPAICASAVAVIDGVPLFDAGFTDAKGYVQTGFRWQRCNDRISGNWAVQAGRAQSEHQGSSSRPA